MRNLLIISLLSIHLIGNTELNQLLHIPYLVIHYYHHLQSGDKISFSEFVSEHYGKGDGNQSDNQEEQQLPFMQFHQQVFTIAVLPVTGSLYTAEATAQSSEKVMKFYSHKLPVGFFGTVLKPPRIIA